MQRAIRRLAIAALTIGSGIGVPAAAPGAATPIPVDLTLVAPRPFAESCCLRAASGSWLGPEYATVQGGGTGVRARIDWTISPNVRATGPDAAARAVLPRGWQVIEAGVTFVPHLVGGRAVGSIAASHFIAQRPGTARFALVVAVPLRAGVSARARFVVTGTRAGERTSASAFVLDGVQAGEWNMQALGQALRSLGLEGVLPPSQVTLRQRRSSFSGAVRDMHGHPVVGARVTLQRRAGGRWVGVGTVRTTERGAFVVPSIRRTPGLYRVSAVLAGVEARSATRAA